jgi:hypothetical protein
VFLRFGVWSRLAKRFPWLLQNERRSGGSGGRSSSVIVKPMGKQQEDSQPNQKASRSLTMSDVQKVMTQYKVAQFEQHHEEAHRLGIDAILERKKIANARTKTRLQRRNTDRRKKLIAAAKQVSSSKVV